jgi:hypothetical protein
MRNSKLLTAAVAAWLVPGAGHFLIGMRRKALLYFVLVVGTFGAGLVLSEFHSVQYDRHPIYFLAYLFNVLPTLVAAAATASIDMTHYVTLETLGTLYCAVASLLNFLVVLDVFAAAERRAERLARGEGKA